VPPSVDATIQVDHERSLAPSVPWSGGASTVRVSFPASSSLLKNLEIESFLFLDDVCWGGAVEWYRIFSAGAGCTLTRGG
jgi:hypothetical protein